MSTTNSITYRDASFQRNVIDSSQQDRVIEILNKINGLPQSEQEKCLIVAIKCLVEQHYNNSQLAILYQALEKIKVVSLNTAEQALALTESAISASEKLARTTQEVIEIAQKAMSTGDRIAALTDRSLNTADRILELLNENKKETLDNLEGVSKLISKIAQENQNDYKRSMNRAVTLLAHIFFFLLVYAVSCFKEKFNFRVS
jgi:hypothetical protein